MEKQVNKKNYYAVVTWLVSLKVGLGPQPCIPGAPGDLVFATGGMLPCPRTRESGATGYL